MRIILLSLFCLEFLGCASLYHVQYGEIDNEPGLTLVPFEIKVSETGVDLQQAARLQRAFLKDNKTAKGAGSIAEIVSLFQMGPRTGAPVYSDTYADKIMASLREQCPSGKITGVTSIREARKYPVISGEIVKIKGYCMQPGPTAQAQQANAETESM